MVQVEVDGHDVALMNLDGEFYALDDQCAHNGGPLSQGRFDPEKGRVSCPWHAWTWDVRTGKALLPPVNYRAPCYTVRVEGDDLLVRTDRPRGQSRDDERKNEQNVGFAGRQRFQAGCLSRIAANVTRPPARS